MKPKAIKDQTIVITGGSSGIGLATAKMAAGRGANVVIISRDEEGMRKICDEIRADGGRADYAVADVGVRKQVARAVDTIVARHGGFDTWFNCAGAGVFGRLDEISDADHERVFQTNYWGVVFGSLEALRHLKLNGGTLINQGSLASDSAVPLLSAYSASKHAVKGFTDALRQELIAECAPVHVTSIKPASVHTPFMAHAKNYRDSAFVVPPPVYAPEVAADAALRTAEKPMREVIVGSSGRLISWFQQTMPWVADRIFARAFPATSQDSSHPPRPYKGGLHKPGAAGEMYGDQGGLMLKSSLYTSAKTRPLKTLATAGVAAAGAAAIVSWMLRPSPQGDQRPTNPDPETRPSTIV